MKAPFTNEQVKALNEFQNSGMFHPFTCGKCRADLVAHQDGWHCPNPQCDYTQDWAHDFMISKHPTIKEMLTHSEIKPPD